MRRTHSSIGHELELDPKVMADQQGHTMGVSLDVYTKTSIRAKAKAAGELARNVLQMPDKKTA